MTETVVLADYILQNGLNAFGSATNIEVCSAQPMSYADAVTNFNLGTAAWGLFPVSIAPSSPVFAAPSVSISGSTTITIGAATAITLPISFLGFSYEKLEMATPLFSATDSDLVGLFQVRSVRCLLRIGGNSVEATAWVAGGPGGTTGQVSPPDIVELAGFLTATGCKRALCCQHHSRNGASG